MTHPLQSDLALYSTGDLPLWRRPLVRMHLAGCDGCRSWVAAFDSDRESIRRLAAEMPQGCELGSPGGGDVGQCSRRPGGGGMRGSAEPQADVVDGMASRGRERRSCGPAGERLVAEHAARG